MEIKHTPGPWEIVPGDEWTTDVGTPGGEYDDGRRRHWNIASVNKRRDEWKANRRLIAAAPDMLDVLMKIHSAGYTNGADWEMVRAVVAKATGGAE